MHEGPGVGGGWAAGQEVVRALNDAVLAVLAALEKRDIDAAQAAARALARVLGGVDVND